MLAVFQLTPSRRATVFLYHVLRHGEYFNSRPHGGRRTTNAGAVGTIISTHALTEGDATKVLFRSLYAFQLTPSRRATEFLLMVPSYLKHFNSRPHGGRPGHRNCKNRVAGHFNSRPHGGRQKQQYFNEYGKRFQLTPSRRATGGKDDSIPEPENFNSRPHGGRPTCTLTCPFTTEISTHALTEGDIQNHPIFHVSCHFNSRPHGGRQATIIRVEPAGNFNSRPHGGRPHLRHFFGRSGCISTHALTEGDGKFRQIFLLNRGYAYSISLYFLPHFISLLPQILSFQQKSFKFQVRIFLLFSVHLAFALQNQCVHHVKYRFCTNMFYFVFVLFTQIVKPQTIGLFIYDFF